MLIGNIYYCRYEIVSPCVIASLMTIRRSNPPQNV